MKKKLWGCWLGLFLFASVSAFCTYMVILGVKAGDSQGYWFFAVLAIFFAILAAIFLIQLFPAGSKLLTQIDDKLAFKKKRENTGFAPHRMLVIAMIIMIAVIIYIAGIVVKFILEAI